MPRLNYMQRQKRQRTCLSSFVRYDCTAVACKCIKHFKVRFVDCNEVAARARVACSLWLINIDQLIKKTINQIKYQNFFACKTDKRFCEQ